MTLPQKPARYGCKTTFCFLFRSFFLSASLGCTARTTKTFLPPREADKFCASWFLFPPYFSCKQITSVWSLKKLAVARGLNFKCFLFLGYCFLFFGKSVFEVSYWSVLKRECPNFPVSGSGWRKRFTRRAGGGNFVVLNFGLGVLTSWWCAASSLVMYASGDRKKKRSSLKITNVRVPV